MFWVFDPDIEHIDPEMVYLFNTKSGKLGDHPKEFSRGVLHAVEGEKSTQAQILHCKLRDKYAIEFLARDKYRCLEAKSIRDKKKKALELKLMAEQDRRRE